MPHNTINPALFCQYSTYTYIHNTKRLIHLKSHRINIMMVTKRQSSDLISLVPVWNGLHRNIAMFSINIIAECGHGGVNTVELLHYKSYW